MKTFFFLRFFFSFFSLFSSCILVVVGQGFYFIYNDLIGSPYRFLLHILHSPRGIIGTAGKTGHYARCKRKQS